MVEINKKDILDAVALLVDLPISDKPSEIEKKSNSPLYFRRLGNLQDAYDKLGEDQDHHSGTSPSGKGDESNSGKGR